MIKVILLSLLLIGCSNEKGYPVVNGKIYNAWNYSCEFGVLYSRGGNNVRVPMLDIKDNKIACTTVVMPVDEFNEL